MQTIAAAANVYKAAKAVSDTMGATSGDGTLAYAETGVGITGSASSDSSDYSISAPSGTVGGKNINITSTKDDINVLGSNIQAGDTLSLTSAKDINLEAANNTEHSSGKHSSYGVEVGVGVSAGAKTGVYVYVALQAASGKYLSDSQTYSNTTLNANNTINLTSNNDTNLKGATANANTINVNAGNNLNIESLQDNANANASDGGLNLKIQGGFGTAWGISGSGNYAGATGNYASVVNQSGLFAGDGGFNVKATNNTDLKGAVISSSDKAIEDNKNSLTTGTLTTSDIKNQSAYDAMAIAVSGSANKQDGAKASGAGYSSKEGDSSSVTKSAISVANITITDETAQKALTGKDAQETIANINTDTKNAQSSVDKLPNINTLMSEQQKNARIKGDK